MEYILIKRKLKKYIILVFLIYICLFFRGFSVIKNFNYTGIRAMRNDNAWVIKNVQEGTYGELVGIKGGDKIIDIDGEEPDDNKIMKRWLVVEQIQSITINRDGEIKKYIIDNSKTLINRYLILSAVGLFLMCYMAIIANRHNSSINSLIFTLFVCTVGFVMVSIIPSSLGVFWGRFILIFGLSVCPIYFNFFIKLCSGDTILENNQLIYLGVIIAIGNMLLCVLNNYINLSYFLREYLAIGILFVFVVLLILNYLLFRMRNVNKNVLNINFPLICLICFIPMLGCYFFPLKWSVPYYIVIPYTLMPVICIVYMLLMQSHIRKHIIKKSSTRRIINSLLITAFICAGIFLTRYIPFILVYIYYFLLVYIMWPVIDGILLGTSGIDKANSLFDAVEEEREAISIYIHDTIIQDVIFYMKKTEVSENINVPKDEVINVLEDVVYYLRELCTSIYPLMIKEMGLKSAIISMLSQFEKKYPVEIISKIECSFDNYSIKKANFILRSIREMVNNSILHGNATIVKVITVDGTDAATFMVKDNGKYKNKDISDDKSHFGLEVIKEKLSLLHGYLEIDTNDGTAIKFKVPYDRR